MLKKEGVDLMYSFKDLYRMYTPCPGLSIGRENFCPAIGSLAGFLKYKDDIYGLTCRHIVFPDAASRTERYKYRDEMSKLNISIPAPMDNDKTLEILRNNLKNVKIFIKVLRERQETFNKDYSKQIHQKKRKTSFMNKYKRLRTTKLVLDMSMLLPKNCTKFPFTKVSSIEA